jgi:hypothetical protein
VRRPAAVPLWSRVRSSFGRRRLQRLERGDSVTVYAGTLESEGYDESAFSVFQLPPVCAPWAFLPARIKARAREHTSALRKPSSLYNSRDSLSMQGLRVRAEGDVDWELVGDKLGSFGQVILTASRYAPGSTFTFARNPLAGAMVGSMVELNVLSKVCRTTSLVRLLYRGLLNVLRHAALVESCIGVVCVGQSKRGSCATADGGSCTLLGFMFSGGAGGAAGAAGRAQQQLGHRRPNHHEGAVRTRAGRRLAQPTMQVRNKA